MPLRMWVFLGTVALCLLTILWLINWGQMYDAAMLALAVGAFVFDRLNAWEQAEKKEEPPEEKGKDE